MDQNQRVERPAVDVVGPPKRGPLDPQYGATGPLSMRLSGRTISRRRTDQRQSTMVVAQGLGPTPRTSDICVTSQTQARKPSSAVEGLVAVPITPPAKEDRAGLKRLKRRTNGPQLPVVIKAVALTGVQCGLDQP